MSPAEVRLDIDRLGRRGEGVGSHEGAAVYVPYALPGESVLAEVHGDHGRLIETLSARADRVAPVCPYFGRCGGCAVQTFARAPYAEWKRNLLVTALAHAGVPAEVGPLVDAHGDGRRRATLHAGMARSGAAAPVGFMEARAHRIVPIEFCPILAPDMNEALPAARAVAEALAGSGKPLDLLVTATEGGLDLDLRGLGPPNPDQRRSLVDIAHRFSLARLSNHGEILIERREPALHIGGVLVLLPPGAFLQATRRGEEVLAAFVLAALDAAKSIADLFCGVGTFSLPLAAKSSVIGFDADAAAVSALNRAVQSASGIRPVRAERRDLFARPVTAKELEAFDGLLFDPPRAGAAQQSEQIAKSSVPTVVAVSCDPGTFARDAATLMRGGYALETVTPIDQFRYSSHLEVVAVFRKRTRAPKPRRLLS